jgi:hypothetical protein
VPGLAAVLVVQAVGEAVGVGAGFDDDAVDGHPRFASACVYC